MGILDTDHSSCCGIVKYSPKLLPMIVVKKDPVHYFSSCASGKQRLSRVVAFILQTASQCLVTCGGLWNLATPMDMLDAEKIPTEEILLGANGWCSLLTRAVPGLG